MTEQKIVLDQMRNAQIVDTYIHPPDMAWIPFPGVEGIDMKVLRVSPETGAWTVLFQMVAGSGFPRHKHLGAGEYLMLTGEIEVRGGVKNGGITAYAGDYGWEPSGMIHDWTNAVVDSSFFFTNHGALQFMDDADNIIGVLDWQGILAIEAAARALEPAV